MKERREGGEAAVEGAGEREWWKGDCEIGGERESKEELDSLICLGQSGWQQLWRARARLRAHAHVRAESGDDGR